jgi:hypothetical protein
MPVAWRRASLLLLAALAAFGQFSSNIQGTVEDPSASAVPGATVTVQNVYTQVKQTSTTNEAGFYRFSSLAPGTYEIKTEAQGFQTSTVRVTVQTAQTADVPVRLQLAATTQQLQVTEQAPEIDVADARIQGTVRQAEMKDLPLQGRNFLGLTVLAPGVTGVGGIAGGSPGDAPDNFSTEKSVEANANGKSFESNAYSVDGLDVTSDIRPGVLNLSPNPESVQEVAIQTNTFSVEHGRASSLEVAITTKSGTNDFHGSAAWFFSDQNLWARSVFTDKYEPFRKHDIAGGFGGPIIKNRAFFFVGAEPLRSAISSSTQVRTFETPQFVNWAKQNFPNTLGTSLLSDYPVTRAAVVGVTQTAQDFFGSSCGTAETYNIPCDLPLIQSGSSKPSPFRNGLQYSARIDTHFNESRDRIYGNFYRTGLDTENFGLRPGLESTNNYDTKAFQVNHTHTFSPRTLNEASFGFIRVEGTNVKEAAFHVPEISVVGQDVGIGTGWGPGTFIQRNYNWRDVVTLVRGSHTLKLGFHVWYGDDDALGFTGVYSRPSFTFNSLLDLVRDEPYDESGVSFDPLTGQWKDASYKYLASREGAFIQDEWKAQRNLTITMGLRWDDFGNAYPAKGTNLSNILLGPGSTLDEQIAGASVLPVENVFENRLINNWSPRVGVAWDPKGDGMWVVRGGFGIFRDWPTLGFQENGLAGNPPGAVFPYFLAGTDSPPLFSVGTSDKLPYGFTYPTIPPLRYNERGAPIGLDVDVGGFDRKYSPPANYNYMIGFERKLGAGFAAGANYAGSHVSGSYQNPGDTSAGQDMNRFAGDLLDDDRDRLNSSFGRMRYNFGWNAINYNAMILTLRKRTGNWATFQASYTLSHTTDYGTNFPDQHKISSYEADAGWDIRHRVSLSGIYLLPTFSQAPLAVRNVLGGWQLGSTVILQSGYPFTVYTSASFRPVRDADGKIIGFNLRSGDYNADGYNYDFPNMPSDISTGGWDRQDYLRGLFAASEFPQPALGTDGNEKRNLFRGPGFANVDAALIKNNRWRERINLQLRFEFFNLFNRVNLRGVSSNLSSSSFGRSTSTYNPRNIQLGLRLEF